MAKLKRERKANLHTHKLKFQGTSTSFFNGESDSSKDARGWSSSSEWSHNTLFSQTHHLSMISAPLPLNQWKEVRPTIPRFRKHSRLVPSVQPAFDPIGITHEKIYEEETRFTTYRRSRRICVKENAETKQFTSCAKSSSFPLLSMPRERDWGKRNWNVWYVI